MIHLGGYHEYLGGVQYCRGTQMTKDDTPSGTHGIPTCIMISYGTEHSPRY